MEQVSDSRALAIRLMMIIIMFAYDRDRKEATKTLEQELEKLESLSGKDGRELFSLYYSILHYLSFSQFYTECQNHCIKIKGVWTRNLMPKATGLGSPKQALRDVLPTPYHQSWPTSVAMLSQIT